MRKSSKSKHSTAPAGRRPQNFTSARAILTVQNGRGRQVGKSKMEGQKAENLKPEKMNTKTRKVKTREKLPPATVKK